MKANTKVRPLYIIAKEIRQNWNKAISGTELYYGAKPYISSMECLTNVSEYYGMDTAESVVRYFLCNASSWRGDKAREIKKELNAMLK